MNNVGKDYFTCIICGKLIMITLMTALFSNTKRDIFLEKGRLLSMAKFFKNFREKLSEVIYNLSFRGSKECIKLVEGILKRCLEEKRRRKTTERRLLEQDLPEVIEV
jgi:predicted butyrate kinase (DUF1464 family)